VTDLVDIAIPANPQAAAETLGLKVSRSVTSGAQVRQIPRDEAVGYRDGWLPGT